VAEHGTTDESPLLLATLPPSDRQRRMAFAIVASFVVAFLITVPFAYIPLPRLDAWIPAFTSAIVITDLITSALLFSQFSIARQRALLVLATGYLFSALIVVPYALTFPGLFAPTGLLGADLQSAVWLYIIWHMASPLSVIVYELFKNPNDRTTPPSHEPLGSRISLSVAIVIAVVCALIAGSILTRRAAVLVAVQVFVGTLAVANLGLAAVLCSWLMVYAHMDPTLAVLVTLAVGVPSLQL